MIIEAHHMIDPTKGYRIRLKLSCGHEETIWGTSHQPQLGDDHFCQTCIANALKAQRKGLKP